MLGQRRRRWTNIESAPGQRPVFTGRGAASKCQIIPRRWINAGPALIQHRAAELVSQKAQDVDPKLP